eukprot:TRINITY_DN21344_c0_g1_i1.p1 TRINITY_DN21344_c0_g1~~TRINITY_DN21344_c0_g1_i1.p1  ORF type:complete len:215 (-),score=46.44 TRINITY_DN21344_c0_g1_i1:230-874(-)
MAHVGERERLENKLTGRDLQRALWVGPEPSRFMPGVPRKMNASERIRMKRDCDEVFPGIIIGSGDSIKNMDYLLDIGVTHVLNTAESDVRCNPTNFSKNGICYKGFVCKDIPNANIAGYFNECAEFIERALSMRCGLVLVNCYMGYSRAATIVAAYMMLKKNFTATQALQYMRGSREVQPNMGFLQQLAGLDNNLRKDRYRKYNHLEVQIQYSI